MKAAGANDISEAYFPPRITKMARTMGLHAGWALDLVETDPDDNKPWDFFQKDKRDKALRKVKEDKPFMLIVSPMCGPFSALQSLLNYPKLKRADVKERLTDAMIQVRFCLEMCFEQHVNGRLFIFEHPAEASSWGMKVMQQMRALDGVRVVKFDFCMLGVKTTDDDGTAAAARKSAKRPSNQPSKACPKLVLLKTEN